MAVNVDTVYKTVLLILNKEQRGYMTPDEFNKIGSQVQREIFEAYFEDLNQQVRIPQTDMEYSDRIAITDEKIAEFKVTGNATHTNNGIFTLPSDLYRLGSLTYSPTNTYPVELQRVGRADFYNMNKSPLTRPTTDNPIYLYEDNKALVYPTSINGKIDAQYVKKPEDIRWGYSTGNLGQLIFDTATFGPNLLNNGGNLFGSITNQASGATPGTYTGEIDITTGFTSNSASGIKCEITVTIDSTGVASSVIINQQGAGYLVGDEIRVNNSVIGGSQTLVINLRDVDFNANSTFGHTDFGLHNSERTEIILKILLYQGIVIRDPQIVQVAAQKVQQEEVNEKS